MPEYQETGQREAALHAHHRSDGRDATIEHKKGARGAVAPGYFQVPTPGRRIGGDGSRMRLAGGAVKRAFAFGLYASRASAPTIRRPETAGQGGEAMRQVPKTPSTPMERLVRALAKVAVDEYLAEERAAREAIAAAKTESPIASSDGKTNRDGHDTSGKGSRAAADAEMITMVAGDRWLSADACAVFLGMATPKGSPNRRGFLERVACRPDFPKQNPITKSWKKSEVDEWAMNQRRPGG